MNKEKWKPVVGYDGIYEVSNFGDVRSSSINTTEKKIRSKYLTADGYHTVSLFKKGVRKSVTVHRLVAFAFILNPNNYDMINHKDGVRTNNNVTNLEWCNNSMNQRHRYDVMGGVSEKRNLTKEQVFKILSSSGYGWRKKISEETGIAGSSIYKIKTGKTYNNWYKEYYKITKKLPA